MTTHSGQRLLDKGSFFLHAAPVNKLIRLTSPVRSKEKGILTAGQDGSIHWVCPLPVTTFRRLFVLEMRLAAVIPGIGGLATRVARQVPLCTTVSHALPSVGQTTVMLPTSNISSSIASSSQNLPESQGNTSSLNSTTITHHLPVSNAIIDGVALRRFFSDSMFDGLARQTLANRFGLDYSSLMEELARISDISQLF